MMKRSFKIRNQNFLFRWVSEKVMDYLSCDGLRTHEEPYEIWINRNLKDREELETLLHEMRHASHPDLSEEAVEQACYDESVILWKLGWRKID